MRTKLSILVMVLVALTVIFTGCDSSGIKAREAELKEKQRLEEEKKLEEQKKIDILFNGKVGELKPDSDFEGTQFTSQKFGEEQYYLKFNTETNSCSIESMSRSAIGSYHTAEYTIKDGKIIFDSTKYSKLMSTYTIEEWELFFRKKIGYLSEEELQANLGSMTVEEFFKKATEGFKKLKFFEKLNETYTKYLKYPALEAEISTDKKTITIKKFVYPDWDKIVELENVVFTRR